jgi:hypothetical protein
MRDHVTCWTLTLARSPAIRIGQNTIYDQHAAAPIFIPRRWAQSALLISYPVGSADP